MKLLMRWLISTFSLFLAALIVPGIRVEDNGWIVYAVMAVILGLINAVVRPMVKFFSWPVIILTLGIFILIINGLMLWLASSIAVKFLHVGFFVDGFKPAFLGALVVTVVTAVLSGLIKEKDEKNR